MTLSLLSRGDDARPARHAHVDPFRLPSDVEDIVADTGIDILFSVVSIWKIAIKIRLGRHDFGFEPDVVLSAAKATGFVELPVDARAALLLRHLPDYHRDPFDRLLIAQTIDAGVELLTSDKALAVYPPLVRLV